MNLYDVYMNAVNNNDGNIIDKLIIAGVEYQLETKCSWGIYEVILQIDGTNDLTIVIYNVNGDIIFKNNNPYYYDMLTKLKDNNYGRG